MSDTCLGQTVYCKMKARDTEVIMGKLLAWSTAYEEFENGPGLYPVGLVRLYANNQVVEVPAFLISFDKQTVYGEPGSIQAATKTDAEVKG